VRRGCPHGTEHRLVVLEGLTPGLVALAEPAGGRQRDDAARAAPSGELERDVAAERAADDVRRLPTGLIEGTLDVVDEHVLVDIAVDRLPSRMPGKRRHEHVVLALEQGQDELPRAPRVGEAVQAEKRRPGAATMERHEHRRHG